MKKILVPLFSLLLVITLLLGSFGSAKAEVGDDPVVTPVSGDMEFTTEVVPIASLPGTIELADLMLAPVGFPEGEAQFEGAGVRVTGMESGKATACFTLSTIAVNQGWGGKVGVWNGSKWVLLPTSIVTGTDEAASTTACAPIAGNGTYAFIKWVTTPEKLPTIGVCTDNPQVLMLLMFPGEGPYFELLAAILQHTPVPAVGSNVFFQVIGSDPAGIVISGGSGYGVVLGIAPEENFFAVGAPGFFDNPQVPLQIEFNPDAPYFEYVTVRITFPDCYFDYQFTDDDFGYFFGGVN